MRNLFLIIILITCSTIMADSYEVAEIYTDLRNQVLGITQQQIGQDVRILAILMETGYPEGIVTLAAIADGTTSIYFSSGGGIIGAGEYQQVKNEVFKFLKIAESNTQNMVATKEFPLPKTSFTRFYVITSSDIYTNEVLEDDLGNERHVLSPMFLQGHQLISYIQTVDDNRNSENSSQ